MFDTGTTGVANTGSPFQEATAPLGQQATTPEMMNTYPSPLAEDTGDHTTTLPEEGTATIYPPLNPDVPYTDGPFQQATVPLGQQATTPEMMNTYPSPLAEDAGYQSSQLPSTDSQPQEYSQKDLDYAARRITQMTTYSPYGTTLEDAMQNQQDTANYFANYQQDIENKIQAPLLDPESEISALTKENQYNTEYEYADANRRAEMDIDRTASADAVRSGLENAGSTQDYFEAFKRASTSASPPESVYMQNFSGAEDGATYYQQVSKEVAQDMARSNADLNAKRFSGSYSNGDTSYYGKIYDQQVSGLYREGELDYQASRGNSGKAVLYDAFNSFPENSAARNAYMDGWDSVKNYEQIYPLRQIDSNMIQISETGEASLNRTAAQMTLLREETAPSSVYDDFRRSQNIEDRTALTLEQSNELVRINQVGDAL